MANLTPLLLNNAVGTVQAGSSAIGSASATGVNVASGEGAAFGTLGTNQYIPAVVVDTSTTTETVKEYVWITARSTDALTVVRQAEDSTRYAASTSTIQAGYVIAAVATANTAGVASGLWTPPMHGYLTASIDPAVCTGTLAGINSRLFLTRIPIPVTITAANILIYLTSAAVSPAGTNSAGIYSLAGSRLASTGDQTTAWQSPGLITMALTSSVVLPGGTDVWVGIQFGSAGAPTLLSTPTGGQPNLGLTNTARQGRVTQSTLPSSFTPAGNVTLIAQVAFVALT